MSNQELTGATHPESQPPRNPQGAQANEVIVDDSGALPTYANFCRVTATPEEVILDFGLNAEPFTAGTQHVKANHHRIVMNVYTTKRLLAAVATTIQRHEQAFGSIETDVSRRVAPSQSQPVPARVADPARQPDVIRLS